ncbi:MAG: PilZ domain-containing protein [Planctomycetes bacterium]|nr:PilZ domain-containing protein [Planctomycetota bacterium]
MITQKLEEERREFDRIQEIMPVRYRLLSVSDIPLADGVRDGQTIDINPKGILLSGTLPSLDLVVPLLTQKVLLSLEIRLPKPQTVVKALARVAWVEAVDEARKQCTMGLAFNEIALEDREKLFEFLVLQQH